MEDTAKELLAEKKKEEEETEKMPKFPISQWSRITMMFSLQLVRTFNLCARLKIAPSSAMDAPIVD